MKWLEKIINTKIQTWTESEQILPPSQSGFKRNKSTQDHILRINQSIVDGFNQNELTGAIFFDLEKTFDKTSHRSMIPSLSQSNLII